jgi:hypothetical protein
LARLVTYSQSFFPAAARLWNEFTDTIMNSPSVASFKHNYLKKHPRPATNPLYYRGDRRTAVTHSRMRIGCSGLNYDLWNNLHVIDSPACTCPSGVDETAKHFLLHCQKFIAERLTMVATLAQLNYVDPNVDLLLSGNPTRHVTHNAQIFTAVHTFIVSTKRFSI